MKKQQKASQFRVGTQFIGNVNHVPMEIVDIKNPHEDWAPKIPCKSPRAYIRRLDTGTISSYGLAALERCDVTIINN